jgi:hypothetical protein
VRFSALIPTKDRVSLLRLAVRSVRDQDYDDWEIVVSDNASATRPPGQRCRSSNRYRIRVWSNSGYPTVVIRWPSSAAGLTDIRSLSRSMQWIEAAKVMVALIESQLPGRHPQARKPRTTSLSDTGAQGAGPSG